MAINRSAPALASAEIYIDAPLPSVWALQTDIRAWPEWNPDVAFVDLRGSLAPGTKFRWKAGGVSMTSVLRVVDSEQTIEWTGQAPLGISAVHSWTFEPEGEGTRVRTEESFEGFLVRVFPSLMQRLLARSLQKNVTALKAELERG